MGITAQFCCLLTGITADSIPAPAFDAARSLVLDGVAVAMAGSRESAAGIIAEHIRSLGGAEQATALNFGFKSTVVGAACLNGASMHVLDYEPMWNPPTHAVSTTLPAVLALGESLGAGGRDMLTALIRGIEAHGRLRVASRQYEPRALVFHPPGVTGPIGSAVAAAYLLKLGPDQLRDAIGIAASRAGALLANIGSMTKCTHCGNAAADGLSAALLAARGLSANQNVVEAPNGLAAGFFAKDWDQQALVIEDVPLRILDPGYAIKLFPSQYATNFVIAAVLEARERIPAEQTIAAVELVGPVMPYVDRPRPSSGLDAKFSFQYAAASALLDGTVGIDTFTDERCGRPDISAMLSKVNLAQSAAIPASLDQMWVEVAITFADGSRVSSKCVRPRGAWGRSISEQEHLVKVRDCMTRVLSENEAENAVALLQDFERLDAAGVRSLMHMLGGFA
ncbi:MAG: MmgE/PrpD family protein [Deltaproteobacteria bacterium]|nr:MmgE/PrpD family protein [Deltaproteobacteria bacterium]